jgi:tRNA-uridine 2-sulfurtransferase
MRIAVGLSGGVDSAVAALLCKRKGHEVLGVFMKIWDPKIPVPEGASFRNACFGPGEEEDLLDVERICETIDIPWVVLDCSAQFEREILSYFRATYLEGQTPNPCVRCNEQLKFGLLPAFLKASGQEHDVFATGHYARIEPGRSGTVLLKKGIDRRKDQSYFLYRLSRKQLETTLFPLGDLLKEDVRRLAREAEIHVWDKEESQDFYSGDYRTLLLPENSSEGASSGGTIVDREGNILGKHEGIWNYTIGQRRGLGLTGPYPMYVLEIDAERNQIVVGREADLFRQGLVASEFNWLMDALPDHMSCKTRSSQPEIPCSVSKVSGDTVEVTFSQSTKGICPGQSVVFYSDDTVVGGGTIEGAF